VIPSTGGKREKWKKATQMDGERLIC